MNANSPRLLSLDQAAALAAEARARGARVVFTDGVFDLLHPGHVRFLGKARALGDLLIVGVHADRAVRADKGPARPVLPASERAEVLGALASVDAVVVLDADAPEDVVARLQPDVLARGADREADGAVGWAEVETRGGRVVPLELAPGFSTTGLIDRMRGGRRPDTP